MENVLYEVVEKIKTRILYSVTFFSENCTVYDIFPKNMAKTEKPHMTSQYGAYALHAGLARLHTLTYSHAHAHTAGYQHARTHRSISNTYCFSMARIIRERTSMLRYTYINCLVVY